MKIMRKVGVFFSSVKEGSTKIYFDLTKIFINSEKHVKLGLKLNRKNYFQHVSMEVIEEYMHHISVQKGLYCSNICE